MRVDPHGCNLCCSTGALGDSTLGPNPGGSSFVDAARSQHHLDSRPCLNYSWEDARGPAIRSLRTSPTQINLMCSFELDYRARALLRELAILCESSITSTEQLVPKIAQRQANVNTEQDAIQYLATLATVQIASRAQMPNYTTMVQHFLGTLQLPMAIYMLGLLLADA